MNQAQNICVLPYHFFRCGDKIIVYKEKDIFLDQIYACKDVTVFCVISSIEGNETLLKRKEYDAIFLAVSDEKRAMVIKRQLKSIGISEKIIYWIQFPYTLEKFIHCVFYPMISKIYWNGNPDSNQDDTLEINNFSDQTIAQNIDILIE